MTNATPIAHDLDAIRKLDGDDTEIIVNEDGVEYVDEDMLEAVRLGKGYRIVVPGKCPGCNTKAPDVACTWSQAERWFNEDLPLEKRTEGFMKYQVLALTRGVHRDCIPEMLRKDAVKQAKAERKAAREAAAKKAAAAEKRAATRKASKAKAEAKQVVAKRVTARKATRKAAASKADVA